MISIHATHTGGDGLPDEIDARFLISIHATHTGGDRRKIAKYITASAISIHATHTGGDRLYRQPPQPLRIFQSTPPTRVATAKIHKINSIIIMIGCQILYIFAILLFFLSVNNKKKYSYIGANQVSF